MDESHRAAMKMRRLKLRHLEVLLAIAEHGGLTAAAAALDSSQPAVSQQLAEIEDALGVALYARGRHIRPTVYLPAVLRYARRALNDTRQLGGELRALAEGAGSLLRVGTMLTTGSRLLPEAILGLERLACGVRLEVVEDIAAGLWARFDRRELDLIVGRLDERAFAPVVRSEALYQDVHCVVAGNGHPLLQKKRVSWRDAAAYPWILPPSGTALRRAIDATFLDQRLAPPAPWIESASPFVNLGLLERSHGLNVVSHSAAARYAGWRALSALPLQLKYDVGPIGMAWPADEESPALSLMLDALRRAAAGRGRPEVA